MDAENDGDTKKEDEEDAENDSDEGAVNDPCLIREDVWWGSQQS